MRWKSGVAGVALLLAAVIGWHARSDSSIDEAPPSSSSSLPHDQPGAPVDRSSDDSMAGRVRSNLLSESFTGAPAGPQPWDPANWDVAVHSRDAQTWKNLEPMHAGHGSDCAPPPASHQVTAYEDAVHQCKDHVMTAINASGYGAIYLTPDHMLDFAGGEAVLRFDVSTLQTSDRDWWDVWLTPYADNLQAPLEEWFPDLAGPPKNAVQISLNNDATLIPRVYRNHQEQQLDSAWWTSYKDVLTPSASARSTVEVRISRTHLKAGLPAQNYWPIDVSFADLGWDRAVVQLAQHSYTPAKGSNPITGGTGAPNTWHWDNVTMDKAVPFTIINADRRFVDPGTTPTVTFDRPALANSHLRFSAMGEQVQVSFNGGASWQAAGKAAQIKGGTQFTNYWMPVPTGTTQVQVRGQRGWLPSWIAKDFAIWSQQLDAAG